jgi:hypothetical protein
MGGGIDVDDRDALERVVQLWSPLKWMKRVKTNRRQD